MDKLFVVYLHNRMWLNNNSKKEGTTDGCQTMGEPQGQCAEGVGGKPDKQELGLHDSSDVNFKNKQTCRANLGG